MKKLIKITGISIGILVVLWFIAKYTGMLEYYSSPTFANYPALKAGESFFVSNLKKPKRFDFISFEMTSQQYGKHRRVFRLCGMEGDKIELRDGVLFVNGKNADEHFLLAHMYFLKAGEAVSALESEGREIEFDNSPGDTVMVFLEDKTVDEQKLQARRKVLPKDYVDEFVEEKFSGPWNPDQFGPITVPEGKYFVLGDNRNYSEDSRYLGFIDKKAWKGTLLGY